MGQIVFSRLLRNAHGHLRLKKVIVTMPASVAGIVQEVARESHVPVRALMGDRSRKCFEARAEAMRRARERVLICGAPPTYSQMAKWFGRHHTTVMNVLAA